MTLFRRSRWAVAAAAVTAAVGLAAVVITATAIAASAGTSSLREISSPLGPRQCAARYRGRWRTAGVDARVREVVSEHLAAMVECDIPRLMAQHPSNVLVIHPGGATISGRPAVRDFYTRVCATGGGPRTLAPFAVRVLAVIRVGTALFVRFELTSAALARPYFGADAYGIVGDKLVIALGTFDPAGLVWKE